MSSQPMRCHCRRHEITNLRCARCDTPICPNCSVTALTGMICRACGSSARSPLYQVSMSRLALAFAACLFAAKAGGWAFLHFVLGLAFFAPWIAFFFGGAIGELALRVTGRKRGPQMEAVAGVAMGLGMLFGAILRFLPYVGPEVSLVTILTNQNPWFYISVVVAVLGAVSRVRFI